MLFLEALHLLLIHTTPIQESICEEINLNTIYPCVNPFIAVQVHESQCSDEENMSFNNSNNTLPTNAPSLRTLFKFDWFSLKSGISMTTLSQQHRNVVEMSTLGENPVQNQKQVDDDKPADLNV